MATPVRIGAFIGLALAVALAIARLVGEKQPVHSAEWWIADLAWAGVVAAPALLALMSHGGRTVLLLPAGALSAGLSVLSLSGAGLPLIVPAVLYLLAFARGPRPTRPVFAAAAVLVPIVAIGGALVALFGQHQIVCWHQLRYRDGRTVLTRDRSSERMSSAGHISQTSRPVSGDVVSEESGCTDGATRPAGSAAAIALVCIAVGAGASLGTPAHGDDER